jgi:RNA polymerase sigma-70 factor, ECF subfamily
VGTIGLGVRGEPVTVSELPLAALVNECMSGRQPAFAELLRRYQGLIFGLCYRMLRHREDAEDATQETFVRIANNLHRWDQERSFEPWIMAIAGNRCRTRLAVRSRRRPTLSLDEPVADRSHLDQGAVHLAEEVDSVLKDVRRECRVAFEMFYRDEMPYADIAGELDVPLGTVKTWVHRARKELLYRLKERGTLGT